MLGFGHSLWALYSDLCPYLCVCKVKVDKVTAAGCYFFITYHDEKEEGTQ